MVVVDFVAVTELGLWAVDDPVAPVREPVEVPPAVDFATWFGLVTIVFGAVVSDGVVDAALLAELQPATRTPTTTAAPSALPLPLIRPPSSPALSSHSLYDAVVRILYDAVAHPPVA